MYESNFCVQDAILYPVTYDDVVLMAQNLNPERGISLRDELKRVLMDRVEDALELFDEHREEIYELAFPDEREELVNAPGWDSKRLEALAWEIHNYLREHELWIDICIYYDGKRMETCHELPGGKMEFRYNGEPFIEEGFDPRDYFEYVANPHILSMSFESSFYDVVNYTGGSLLDGFEKLLNKHGLYYELGNAWNLTVMEG